MRDLQHRRQRRCSRGRRCRASATPRTGWRAPRRFAGSCNPRDARARQDLRALPARARRQQRARLRRPAAEDGRAVRRRPARPRAATPSRFRFVMVDEYQDTNRPQYLLIRRLAEAHRNLCVVGDPDQSIYKWRGADLRNILDFEHDFPEAHDRPARAELPLDAGHPRRRVRRHQPEPRTARRSGSGPSARAATRSSTSAASDELEEADFIARTARRARSRTTGDTPMAVLYRTNAQSRAIEDALRARGHRLPHHRRRPVLRAQGDQGRARLPEAPHQPARRREPAARDQRAGARHRQGRDGRARRPPPAGAAAAARGGTPALVAALAVVAAGRRPRRAACFTGARAPRRCASFRDLIARPRRGRAAGAGLDRARQGARPDAATCRRCARSAARRPRAASRT